MFNSGVFDKTLIDWTNASEDFSTSGNADIGGDLSVDGSIQTFGMLRQVKTWHAFGGFQDKAETISISATSSWTHVTNASGTLWNGTEADGLTLSNDSMYFTNAGDYTGTLSMSLSGLNGKDFQVRIYNVTQSTEMGYHIGITTTGANNYANIVMPLYLEIEAGDELKVEVRCMTDGSDPVFKHAIFYIAYLHD